jgi:hypothetical protein
VTLEHGGVHADVCVEFGAVSFDLFLLLVLEEETDASEDEVDVLQVHH